MPHLSPLYAIQNIWLRFDVAAPSLNEFFFVRGMTFIIVLVVVVGLLFQYGLLYGPNSNTDETVSGVPLGYNLFRDGPPVPIVEN